MDAFEDLREGFAALEVQVAVVGGLGQALAAVVDTDQVLVRLLGRPTGPTESDESNWPSISPMLKLTPNAGPASVEARLTARGSLPGARTGLLMSSTLLHVHYCYGSEHF
jgi:hypothetical protein